MSAQDSSEGSTSGAQKPERGTLWPFVAFLALTFFFVLPATYPALTAVHGDMQSVARAFAEGGAVMYLLLLYSIVGMVIYWGLSFPYIIMGRVPSSILVLPALIPILLGVLGARNGLAMVHSVMDQAAPEMLMAFAYRGISISLHAAVFGALVAAVMFGSAALSGLARCFAWTKGKPLSLTGGILTFSGVVLCGAVVFFTCFSRGMGMLGMVLGASALAATVVIGGSALVTPSSWRSGAARILTIVSSCFALFMTWLAVRWALFSEWASVLDQAAPERRASFIGRGQATGSELDLAGGLLLVVVGVVAIISLLMGGRQMITAARKFRVPAAITVITIIVTAFLTASLGSSMDALVAEADRGDGTYFARSNEGFQPAKSNARPYGIGSVTPMVIIDPDGLWIDDQRIVAADGFTATGESGQAFEAALRKSLDSWDARQRAFREAEPIIQEEVEDWIQQEVRDGIREKKQGRRNAKKSDNRFGIKGPADNPGSRFTREQARELAENAGLLDSLRGTKASPQSRDRWSHLVEDSAPPRANWSTQTVNMAVHRNVPFSRLREVSRVLRTLGIVEIRLLVRSGEARGNIVMLEERPRGSPTVATDFGRIKVRIGPGQCSRFFGEREARHMEQSLGLSATVTGEQYEFSASGGVLPEGCSTLDLEQFRSCIDRIGSEFVEERSIIVSAAPTVEFQALVTALDAIRGDDVERYPGSTAPFDEVFLFSGDDLQRACHPPLPEGNGEPDVVGSDQGIGGGTDYSGRSRGRLPTIQSGSVSVRGSLSREVIRRFIRRSMNQLRFCYEQGLERQPDLTGQITIRFVIAPSGAVTTSSVAESTLNQPQVERCVARVIQRIGFPQPEGGGVVIVNYPMTLEPSTTR